jgi:hypothetical protein|uniref:DUF551 domain-containing protein n=1 Tax=Podoviridae sp. ctIi96 TaxID=2826550 RepID=A0A8S5M1B6_9CAUD|nr:MAG TPA: Protein of unknown function (DUF551) [Podoviridae sp. ctIi96]
MERNIDMGQTVEEAAHFFAESRSSGSALPAYYHGFIAGAEWQAKQSPWISVEERLPECNTEVVIYHEYRFYVGFMYYSMKSIWWRVNEDERTDMIVSEYDFWMPIPDLGE